MILDTSVIVALLLKEPGWEDLLDTILAADRLGVAAPTLVEAGIVLTARLGQDARPLLARFLQEADVHVLPFGEPGYVVAIDAYLRFGKGRHPAALNFGDCMAYATAAVTGAPLLWIGEDFAKTDVRRA